MPRRPQPKDGLLAVAWCAVSLNFGIQASIVGPTASILASRTHSSEKELGPVLGMGGLCTLIGGMPSGWLIDRVPGNPLLAVTLLLQALGYALMPYCSSVMWLAIVYASIGLTFNIVNTGVNVMVIWQFRNPRQLSLILNLVSAMFGLGGILAPQLVTLATRLGDGIMSYYMISVASVVVALSVAWLHSPVPTKKAALQADQQQASPDDVYCPPDVTDSHMGTSHHTSKQAVLSQHPQHKSRASQDEIVGCLLPDDESDMASSSIGPGIGTLPTETNSDSTLDVGLDEEEEVSGRAPGAGNTWCTAHWGVLCCALLVVFANVSIELGFAAWITTYCKNVIGMGDEESRGMTSTYWAAFTAGRAAGAVLAAVLSAPTLLLITMPLSVVGPAMAMMTNDPHTTLVSVILVGLGAACGFPSTLSITAEVLDLDGSINGVISTVAGLAMTAMPAMVPQLAKWDPRHGFSWLMILTLALGVSQLLGLVMLLVFKTRLQRRLDACAAAGSDDADQAQAMKAPLLVHDPTIV